MIDERSEQIGYALHEAQVKAWKEGDRRIYNVLDTILMRMEAERDRWSEDSISWDTWDKAASIVRISRNAHTVVD